jgi:hypothetical protein
MLPEDRCVICIALVAKQVLGNKSKLPSARFTKGDVFWAAEMSNPLPCMVLFYKGQPLRAGKLSSRTVSLSWERV